MKDNNLEINEINPASPDFRTDLADKIADLAPEAVADGKIDFEKLRELLSDDVSNASERFGLFWPGKKNAIRQAQTPTTATLKPDFENSKDWDNTQNVFIEGDNLEVLKILQNHYYGKIKMIYIDPPYNTGKDFVYKDNFRDGIKTYKEWTQQVGEDGKALSSNADTDGRYHSNWLNMMYPRLKLARNLLTQDGLIFISINESEIDNLQKVIKEIFGEHNMIATLIWKNKKGGGNDSKYIATEHEYIVTVAKDNKCLPKLFIPHSAEYLKRYKENDTKGRFYWDTFRRKSGKQYYPITAPDGSILEYDELGNRISWLRSKARFKKDLQDGEVKFTRKSPGSWSVHFKQREPEGKKPRSLLTDYGTTGSGSDEILQLFRRTIFDNPKPTTLISHLVAVATKQHDTILDFFSGSASTAHAVMLMNAQDGGNRKHIQVQIPEPVSVSLETNGINYRTIADISRERIRRAGAKIESDYSTELSHRFHPLDSGFRAYKLSDTNFVKWNFSSNMTEDELKQGLFELEDSSNDHTHTANLFTELLLKQGLSLTERVSQTEIAGLKLHAIIDGNGDFAMLAYLDEHTPPSLGQLREIIENKPTRFVMLEDGFGASDELKTNLVQICKTNNVELWTA